MQADYSKEAVAYLARMPAHQRIRIIERVDRITERPQGLAANVTPLKGQPGMYRLRVGAYRVIFHTEDKTLFVDTVAPRGRVYR